MKLAWLSRSQDLFVNIFFCLLHPPWTNVSKQIFSNDYLSCFEGKYCAVPKTLFVCLLYIYTFPMASFKFFVQWTDLGLKYPFLVEKTAKSTKSKSFIYARLIVPTCKTINDIEFFSLILARYCLVQTLKRANIGCQDFWDKCLGWFLGCQYKQKLNILLQNERIQPGMVDLNTFC